MVAIRFTGISISYNNFIIISTDINIMYSKCFCGVSTSNFQDGRRSFLSLSMSPRIVWKFFLKSSELEG